MNPIPTLTTVIGLNPCDTGAPLVRVKLNWRDASVTISLIPLLLLAAIATATAQQKPNFLFLLSDDQAWNGLSCQMHPDMPDSKHPLAQTPNLERLASEGMRFSAAYSPASVCSPTRISLQTGKSPAQCGWTKAAASMRAEDGFKLVPPQGRRHIGDDEVTIGEMLQSAGYRTAHFGKWHLGGGGPDQHGYDASDGDTGNSDAGPHVEPNPVDIFGMGERAVAFMESSDAAGKPFFIQMSYHALHYPQNAPKALVEKYQELNPRANEKEVGRAALAEELDRGIGQLLAKIEALGIADNTYVIYMSDNGSSTKQLLRGGKGGVWEGGVRVPMIVRGPGVRANSWQHQRVVGYDWFPTFCELAGVEHGLPPELEGGLLTSLLAGGDEPVERPREELVFHFPHYQGDAPHTALFLGNHKLLRFYEDDSLLLFDVGADISESRNLAEVQPELARQLLGRMEAYLAAVDAQMPTPNPQFEPENPPVLKEKRGDRGGKGKKRTTTETEPDTPAKPVVVENQPPQPDPEAVVVDGIDLSPEAFRRAAMGEVSGSSPAGDSGLSWLIQHARELDINGDGEIGRAELMDQARLAFRAFDVDGNGILSDSEYQGSSPEMAVAGFLTSSLEIVDANSDSIITAQEFAEALRRAFDESDRDQSGSISAIELED